MLQVQCQPGLYREFQSWAFVHSSVVSALGRPRPEGCWEPKVSLGYRVKLCLKKINKTALFATFKNETGVALPFCYTQDKRSRRKHGESWTKSHKIKTTKQNQKEKRKAAALVCLLCGAWDGTYCLTDAKLPSQLQPQPVSRKFKPLP